MTQSRRSSRPSLSLQMVTLPSLGVSATSETLSRVGLGVWATLPISMKQSRQSSRPSLSLQMVTLTSLGVSTTWETLSRVGLGVWATLPISMKQTGHSHNLPSLHLAPRLSVLPQHASGRHSASQFFPMKPLTHIQHLLILSLVLFG